MAARLEIANSANLTTFLEGRNTARESLQFAEVQEGTLQQPAEKAKEESTPARARKPLRQRISAMFNDQKMEENELLGPGVEKDENVPNLNGPKSPAKVFKKAVISKNGKKRYVYHCIHGKRKGRVLIDSFIFSLQDYFKRCQQQLCLITPP